MALGMNRPGDGGERRGAGRGSSRPKEHNVERRMTGWLAIVLAVVLIGTWLAVPASAETLVIRNEMGPSVTLSDLYFFSEKNCQGTEFKIYAMNDDLDDIEIPAGESISVEFEAAFKSFRISWKNSDGKELEMDTNRTVAVINANLYQYDALDRRVAFLASDEGGPLPPIGTPEPVVNGRIVGGAYDWLQFFDTTASSGVILYDGLGSPISPPLTGVNVTAEATCSLYIVDAVPTVSRWGLILAVLLLVGTAVVLLRRRQTVVQ
jgi:hypothetical protein